MGGKESRAFKELKEVITSFSQESRNALELAQEEALRFNHPYVGTEHILLGLIREGTVSGTLTKLGVTVDKVRSATEFIIGRGDRMLKPSDIRFTPRAKTIMELASDECRKEGSMETTPYNLLVGVVREGEGIAAGVLESLGASLSKLKSQVKEDTSESTKIVNKLKLFFENPTVDQVTKKRMGMIIDEMLDLLAEKKLPSSDK